MDRDLSRSRAILIGNATYQHPNIPDLPAASACVDAMERLLTSELCGWPAERVTTLVDLPAPPELASRVVDAVRDTENVLLVYYVGHGLRTSEGQLALALGQTNPHPELLAHTGMLYENLAKILRGCRAATKLVILDCCHAELANKAHYVFQSADLAEVYPVDGLYFIGASAKDKKAKAPIDGTLTYFTDAFITVVNQGIPQGPPMLRLDQIFLELRARLLRANLPEPVESGTRGARQFPFARNAAPPDTHHDLGTAAANQPDQAATASRPLRLSRRGFLIGAGVLTVTGGATTAWIATRTPHPANPAASALGSPLNGAGAVVSVAFSPNGRTLASGGVDDIRLWDVTDPAHATFLGPLTGYPSLVESVAFSPNGRTLASGTFDRMVRLWDVTDPAHPGALGQPLTRHTGAVYSMAFSPSGRTLASGDGDKTIRLWDVTNPAHPAGLGQPLAGHTGFVESVAFSPNGPILASGGADNTIRLWDVTDPAHPGALGQPLTRQAGVVYSVAFSPNGHTLASGSYDRTIQLWAIS